MVNHPTLEACPECGARMHKDADQCDLCGYVPGRPLDESGEVPPGMDDDEGTAQPATGEGVYCNQCGWKNPPASRFCSQCGSRLQDMHAEGAAAASAQERNGKAAPPSGAKVDATAVSTTKRTPSDDEGSGRVGKQVGIIVAAGVLLVVALFLITALSRDRALNQPATTTTDAPASAQGATGPSAQPLPPQLAERAADLEAQIEDLSGEEKLTRQRELVDLYLNAGRFDRAAYVQQEIAETLDSPETWTFTGNLFYGWMQQAQGASKQEAGQQAIAAYQRVLEQQPDNLGVRTDMATAYLGTNNPMEGVRQIKMVLEQAPDHVQANFNYGVMLSMIGRTDQAIEQFEKVKTLVPVGSEDYQLAERAIEQMQQSAGRP